MPPWPAAAGSAPTSEHQGELEHRVAAHRGGTPGSKRSPGTKVRGSPAAAGRCSGSRPCREIRRPPARRPHPELQLVPPAPRPQAVAPQLRVDLEVCPERVEAAQRLAGPVHRRVVLALLLEAAEQAVPDDQDAAVVAVEVAVVHRVVHAVVRGGGEHARTSPGGRRGRCGSRTGRAGRSARPSRTARAGRRRSPSAGRGSSRAGRRSRSAAVRWRGCSPRSIGARRGGPGRGDFVASSGGASSSRSRRRPALPAAPTRHREASEPPPGTRRPARRSQSAARA